MRNITYWGMGFLVVSMFYWGYRGFDYGVLSLLILGVCFVIPEIVDYVKKRKKNS